jgi:caffeoyl-CoA O-methyltransferase
MSNKSIGLSDDLHAYLIAHNPPLDPVTSDLIAETQSIWPDLSTMPIAPEQASFLTFLTRMLDARQAVEVGTFTGFSSLAIARGLAPGGRLTCFDVSADYTAIARSYWERAGVADRIELRIGPAAENLSALPDEPHLDLAFIDADKVNNRTYWDALVPRLRPGGLVLVDNVLHSGGVLAPDNPSDEAIVSFNDYVLTDPRVDVVMLPLADGLTIGRRLPT